MARPRHWLTGLVLLSGCQDYGAPLVCERIDEPTNVLIVVADDMGVDKLGFMGVGADPPPTPTLDALAAEGMFFDRAYANPACSPTRATLMTGRHGWRTGIGRTVMEDDAFVLPLGELTIAEAAKCADDPVYSTSAAGKWHLGSMEGPAGAEHPLAQGFDWAAGSLANFRNVVDPVQEEGDYYHWEKNDNGVLSWTRTYATTDTTDDAIARLERMPEPWLLYVAYNAPHEPHMAHPAEFHSYELTDDSSVRDFYDAAVESMDTELGRLIDALGDERKDRTNVLFLGDNGTPKDAIAAPYDRDHAKLTLFEGGVRVPVIVRGPAVSQPGSRSDAWVQTVDLFPTIVEWFGLDVAQVTGQDDGANPPITLDGLSLAPWLQDPDAPSARETVYAESFAENGDPTPQRYHHMIRDAHWKLITHHDAPTELYAFEPDQVNEGPSLLEEPLTADAQEACDRLEDVLDAQILTMSERTWMD